MDDTEKKECPLRHRCGACNSYGIPSERKAEDTTLAEGLMFEAEDEE